MTELAKAVKATSRAFYGAYLKGRKAWATDGDKARCPYPEWTTSYHNGVTFSRTFIRMWHEGYEDAKAGKPEFYRVKP